MSKKDKKVIFGAADSQAVMAMIPKLEGLMKTYQEIAVEYQMYRKNGGDEIPGIEKHLGLKEQMSVPSEKTKKSEKIAKTESPEEKIEVKKAKKKDK